MENRPITPDYYWEACEKIEDPKKKFEFFQYRILQHIFEEFEMCQNSERENEKIKFIFRVKEAIAIAKKYNHVETNSLIVTWDDNFLKVPKSGKGKKFIRVTNRSLRHYFRSRSCFNERYTYLNSYENIKRFRIMGYLHDALREMFDQKVITEAIVNYRDKFPGGWEAELVFKF